MKRLAILFWKTRKMFSSFYIMVTLISMTLVNSSVGQTTLTLAVHPDLSYQQIEEHFTPLAEYLGLKTGYKIELRIGSEYQENISEIGNDKVDLAFLGPVGYIETVEHYGNKTLLATLGINGASFTGKIIIREDNNKIKTLSDLGENYFAFVDQNSTMGYIVPLYMLLKHGNVSKVLMQSKFLGSHENVALGVLSGDFEAGAVKEDVYFAYKDLGLKELASTPGIPEHVFVARRNLPLNIIQKIKKALFELSETKAGRDILKSINQFYNGVSEVNDSDYNGLRNIMAELRKNGLIK